MELLQKPIYLKNKNKNRWKIVKEREENFCALNFLSNGSAKKANLLLKK